MDPSQYNVGFNSYAPSQFETPYGPAPIPIFQQPHKDISQEIGFNQMNQGYSNKNQQRAPSQQSNMMQQQQIVAVPLRRFTQDERILVKKVIANIINFMQEDNLTPQDVFGQYDYQKKSSITIRDAERALYEDLYIEPDANCNLFIEYYREANEKINLKLLYIDLDRFSKARVNRKQFDLSRVQEQLAANPLALMPREKLLGYSHASSKIDLASVNKMKSKIEKIKDFFLIQYGYV